MSEPTIRLPLRMTQYGPVDDDGEVPPSRDIVSLVNSQAERIRGLEEALIESAAMLEAWLAVSPDVRVSAEHVVTDCLNEIRAELDKAGKETE